MRSQKTWFFAPALLLVCLSIAAAQTSPKAAAPLSFEVASIKPAPPLDPVKMAQQMQQGLAPHIGMKVDKARVDIGFMSLTDIIGAAYKVKRYQINGPDWMGSLRFDILATLPEGANKDQVPEMLQNLLAERFKLTLHHDSKDLPVYELGVGKNGIKLKESLPDPEPAEPDAAAGSTGAPTIRTEGGGKVTVSSTQGGTMRMQVTPNGQMHIEASKMTMQQLADTLTTLMGRPVLDKTGLTGNYQVSLDLSMEDLRNAAASAGVAVPALPGRSPSGDVPAASDPSGSSMFQAMQELGLKLESKKSPLDILVIDHLEKVPTDN